MQTYITKNNTILVSGDSIRETFNDIDQVPNWASQGVEMMRSKGLFVGDANGNYNPNATATRAEAATIFARLCRYTEGDAVIEPPPIQRYRYPPTVN